MRDCATCCLTNEGPSPLRAQWRIQQCTCFTSKCKPAAPPMGILLQMMGRGRGVAQPTVRAALLYADEVQLRVRPVLVPPGSGPHPSLAWRLHC